MRTQLVASLAFLALLAPPARAPRITQVSLPLAEVDATRFVFAGNLAVAIRWDGTKSITARMQGFDLAAGTALWRQDLRVQESEDNHGALVSRIPGSDRIFVGNGPLTLLDLATGKPVWSLDCKAGGNLEIAETTWMRDGTMILTGSSGCGDREHRRLLRVDAATGKVLWQVDVEAGKYKEGARELLAFNTWAWTPPGDTLPSIILAAGKRAIGIDYVTGAPRWKLDDPPGRVLGSVSRPGHLIFWDEKDVVSYDVVTGARQWTYRVNAGNWLMNWPVNASDPESDLLLVTDEATHRVSLASGKAVWVTRRGSKGGGSGYVPPYPLVHVGRGVWAALDVETGAERWRFPIEHPLIHNVAEDVPATSGTILFRNMLANGGPPYELIAVDPATGRLRWRHEKVLGELVRTHEFIPPASLMAVTRKAVVLIDLASGSITDTMRLTGEESQAVRGLADSPRRAEVGDLRLVYSRDRKELTGLGPSGAVRWRRAGEESENAVTSVLPGPGLAIFPQKNGTVEFLNLATGEVVHSVTGNAKPVVAVDPIGNRVLVPRDKALQVITVSD